jgi:hypothetical protein
VCACSEPRASQSHTQGHSNDNRFVEQKNDSLVRAYLGHLHLYTHQHVEMLTALNTYNLFQPVLRQIERKAVPLPNGTVRILRKHDVAATLLTRLLRAKPPISSRVTEKLIQQRQGISPLALNREIHQQLATLYRLAAPDT